MTRSQLYFKAFEGHAYGPRDGMVPRAWQLESMDQYLSSVSDWSEPGPHVFCVYAGTGSGKTKVAGMKASAMLNGGMIEQVVVVVPNRSILYKTKREFFRYFGIELVKFNKRKHSDGIPRMQQGYILTYGALMNDPTLHRRLTQAARALVIFDEIHHLGDGNGWGDGAVEAFGNVGFIIALTGTPYRSDNTRIPFVRYVETMVNGILQFEADFKYPLGRAVADGVCRKPIFYFHDGVVMVRKGPNLQEKELSFDNHKVSEQDAALRLRGAVMYPSATRKKMLAEALDLCREQGRKVIIFLGGDTEGEQTPREDAWNLLPRELEELGITSNEFDVVTGDDQEAQKKIEVFGASNKWIIVSINMISEGTDIPELSAAIFLTSITAKQTTIQRIGRILRLMGEDDPSKDAYIFMFADRNLKQLSDEIDYEVKQEINLLRKKREAADGDGNGDEPRYRAEAIGISGGNIQTIKFHGREWPISIIEKARQRVKELGLPPTMLQAIALLLEASDNAHD